MKAYSKAILKISIFIYLFFMLEILVYFFTGLFTKDMYTQRIFLHLIQITILIFVGKSINDDHYEEENYYTSLNISKISINSILTACLMGVLLNIFILTLFKIKLTIWGISDSYIAYAESMKASNFITKALVVFIIVPIFEELFFRGLILEELKRLTKSIHTSNLIQAILFGLIHALFFRKLLTFFLGLVIGYIYIKTKSIIIPIIIHMVNNLASYYIGGIIDQPYYILTNITTLSAIAVLSLIGIIILMFYICSHANSKNYSHVNSIE